MKVKFDALASANLCRERGVSRLELFGSALRDDFRDDGDVDLLCTMRPDVKCGLFEWVALKLDFERFFGHPVDLVSRKGIERSPNPYRSNPILNSAVPIYVEG